MTLWSSRPRTQPPFFVIRKDYWLTENETYAGIRQRSMVSSYAVARGIKLEMCLGEDVRRACPLRVRFGPKKMGPLVKVAIVHLALCYQVQVGEPLCQPWPTVELLAAAPRPFMWPRCDQRFFAQAESINSRYSRGLQEMPDTFLLRGIQLQT